MLLVLFMRQANGCAVWLQHHLGGDSSGFCIVLLLSGRTRLRPQGSACCNTRANNRSNHRRAPSTQHLRVTALSLVVVPTHAAPYPVHDNHRDAANEPCTRRGNTNGEQQYQRVYSL